MFSENKTSNGHKKQHTKFKIVFKTIDNAKIKHGRHIIDHRCYGYSESVE